MCKQSWGKNDYARALIKVSSLNPLKDSIVVAIPFPNRSGYSLETVDVEYEWTPPRCDTCKIFDHVDADCHKRVKEPVAAEVEEDGFTKVTHRHGKKKQDTSVKQVAGIKLSKLKTTLLYKVVSKQPSNEEGLGSNQVAPDKGSIKPSDTSAPTTSNDANFFSLSNSFASLTERDKNLDDAGYSHLVLSPTDLGDDNEEEVEVIYNKCDYTKGASTPSEEVKDV
ncbi:hypothetical protein Tco_1288528 [Tanacetum coccineum]